MEEPYYSSKPKRPKKSAKKKKRLSLVDIAKEMGAYVEDKKNAPKKRY